jgi:hypothetical protein
MSHTVNVGNTKSPVAFLIKQNDKQISLSGMTVKVFGKNKDYTAWIAERTTGVTAEPIYTFTVNAANLMVHVGHIVKEGYRIRVSNSGGSLPTGLAASTAYYAVNVTDSEFGLASVPGGASLITAAGSGTQSYAIDGLVTVDWQTADVTTVGEYRLYLNVYSGSEYDTFPTTPADGTRNPGETIYVVDAA